MQFYKQLKTVNGFSAKKKKWIFVPHKSANILVYAIRLSQLGILLQWVLHIFMQPLVCLASQVDPTPPIERPTPLINPHCHLTVSCAACLCRPAVA